MNAQTELFRPAAPFLGQGDLFCPVPPDVSRVIQVCGLVREGVMSPSAAVGEVTIIGRGIWQPSTDRALDILSEPRWPLRLVVAWILHAGDAARIAEAYEEARRWRFPIEAREEWREAFDTLRRALALGTVSATARRGRDGAASIAAEEWDELRPVVSGSVVILRKDREPRASAYYNVRFDAAAIKAHWKPMTRATAASKATIKMKTDAQLNLTAMMRADPENPISKAEVRKQAAYAGVPKRMFDDVWKAAVIAAKAPAWGASGRRPKHHPSPASSA